MACYTPPLILRGSLFLSSRVPKVCSRVSSWTARQYHSLCMLGLGFVASLAIIWVIRNYGKFKISIAIQIENATTFSDKACCTQAGQAHAAGHGGGMVRWQHFSPFFLHALPVAPIAVARRDWLQHGNSESSNKDKRHWQIAMQLLPLL